MATIELGKSRWERFLSGSVLAFRFSDDLIYESPEPEEEVRQIWATVGGFLANALREGVAKEPSLPPLPEDIYSDPEATSKPSERQMSQAIPLRD